ncbi:MAG: hypothetical protein AAF378_01740 [Cyanobacteria bacterium P01_A01_bin.84]
MFTTYVNYVIDNFQTKSFPQAIAGLISLGLSSDYLVITGKFLS